MRLVPSFKLPPNQHGPDEDEAVTAIMVPYLTTHKEIAERTGPATCPTWWREPRVPNKFASLRCSLEPHHAAPHVAYDRLHPDEPGAVRLGHEGDLAHSDVAFVAACVLLSERQADASGITDALGPRIVLPLDAGIKWWLRNEVATHDPLTCGWCPSHLLVDTP